MPSKVVVSSHMLVVAPLCHTAGLLRGLPLEKCASIGCMAGAAAVQTVGADMGPPEWHWLHQRLHSGLAAAVIDNTPQEIFKELLVRGGAGVSLPASQVALRTCVFWCSGPGAHAQQA